MVEIYNHGSFKVADLNFGFNRVEECRKLLRGSNLEVNSEIAADVLSNLSAEKTNNMYKERGKEHE